MVAQARRYRMAINVVADELLGVIVPSRLVLLTIGVLGVGLQMQEVSADRSVTVLESGQDDTVLHLCHLRASQNR